MPKRGTSYPLQVHRINADGDDVDDAVEGDFTLTALRDDESHALVVSDFVNIGDGDYVFWVDVPTTGSRMRIDIACANPSTDRADPDVFEGDLTANSLDDVAIAASRPPSISIAANVGRDSPYRIEVFTGDARTISVPIYDDNGTLVDLTLWENFRFSIQNAGQTAVADVVPYNLDSGLVGNANGYLDIPIPEDCSAFDLLDVGIASVTAYWSVDANLIAGGTSTTRTLRAGPFVIKRKETPSP